MTQQNDAIAIFCCYAREDEVLFNALQKRLSLLQRENRISVWHTEDISPGTEPEQQIKKYLNEANIILLLMSSDSLYRYDSEMKDAMARHEQNETRVIPIILRPVAWPPLENSLFGRLQALPKGAKPITTWENEDEAWKDVTEGINRVVNELRESRKRCGGGWDHEQAKLPPCPLSGEVSLENPTSTPAVSSLGLSQPQVTLVSLSPSTSADLLAFGGSSLAGELTSVTEHHSTVMTVREQLILTLVTLSSGNDIYPDQCQDVSNGLSTLHKPLQGLLDVAQRLSQAAPTIAFSYPLGRALRYGEELIGELILLFKTLHDICRTSSKRMTALREEIQRKLSTLVECLNEIDTIYEQLRTHLWYSTSVPDTLRGPQSLASPGE